MTTARSNPGPLTEGNVDSLGGSEEGASTIGELERIPLPETEVLPTLPGFEVQGKLGRGGMSEVYLARQISVNRLVALKKLLGGKLADPTMVAHLRGEAEALGRLRNPHIVQIYGVEEHQGESYLVMEYVEGGSLQDVLKRRPIRFLESAQLVETLARAMNAAHQQGIVHLDLKPENILMTAAGAPKISDFGLAKRLDQETEGQTGRVVVGTLEYMSPEQAKAEGRKIGPAADVYGLGAILYRLLTGRPPFVRPKNSSGLEILHSLIEEEPPRPRLLNPRAPRDLDTICRKCLNKDAAKRYASAEALADDLRRYQEGRPIQARRTGPLARSWKWARRHPGRVAVIVAMAGLAVGLGLWQNDKARHRADLGREDDKDWANALGQVSVDRHGDARKTISSGRTRIEAEPSLADRTARWRRLEGVVQFSLQAEQAWFRTGEERYEEAQAACEAALTHLGIIKEGRFTDSWWDRLPLEDLKAGQASRVRQEVYRQILLLTYVRSVPWTNDLYRPEAPTAFRSSLEALAQARIFERDPEIPRAKSVAFFTNIIRLMLGLSGTVPPPLTAEEKARLAVVPGQLPAIDYFFIGAVHYYLAQAGLDRGPAPPGFAILVQALPKDVHVSTARATAEAMLRESVRLDERQYWPHFILGRTLLLREKYAEAEMAFAACGRLQPEYPVSFQFRALALARQAVQEKDPGQKAKLLKWAEEDSAKAMTLAQEANNFAIYWARGEMFEALGESAQALATYAAALEWERDLHKKVSRSTVLKRVEGYLQQLQKSAGLRADALGVLALLHLHRDEKGPAQSAADRALTLDPEQPWAKMVRDRLANQK